VFLGGPLYCTTSVAVVVCEVEPEVPVMVIVELPAGVPVLPPPLEEPLLPPQPQMKRKKRASELTATRGIRTRRFCVSVNRITDRMNATEKIRSLKGGIDGIRSPTRMFERAVVVTVTVAEAAAPFGVTLVGDTEQVAAMGAPLHARLTAELKPPLGVTESV
jgi:hypothetical protein